MSIINLIKTSIYSLKSHKLRAFLTMIGIIIGISSVVTILAIGNGLKEEVLKSSEDTSANKINVYFTPDNAQVDLKLIEPFSKTDIYTLKNVKGIEKVQASEGGIAGFNFFAGSLGYFDKQIQGMLDTYEDKKLDIEYGRGFRENEGNKRLIVLEKQVAEELFKDAKKAIGKGISLNGEYYEVIGTLKKAGAFSLMGSYSYISKECKNSMTKENTIRSIDIFVQPNEDKVKVFENAKKQLDASHPNIQGKYELQDPQEITKAFEKIIGGLTTFIAFVTGISLFVGGIGVMNIMYVSVSERKREIGIRRAIGAKPKSILLQFLIESIMVTGMGGLLGIVFGYGVAKIVGFFLPFEPVLTAGSFIGATLISVLVGIVFGIIPASNAAKMDPIKAIYK